MGSVASPILRTSAKSVLGAFKQVMTVYKQISKRVVMPGGLPPGMKQIADGGTSSSFSKSVSVFMTSTIGPTFGHTTAHNTGSHPDAMTPIGGLSNLGMLVV